MVLHSEVGTLIVKSYMSIMTDQGNIAPHGNSYEKILGMKYMLEFDSLQVGEFQLDAFLFLTRNSFFL